MRLIWCFRRLEWSLVSGLLALLLFSGMASAQSTILTQCPADEDGIDTDGNGVVDDDHYCLHLSGGDGFVTMADGQPLYIFSFAELGESNDQGNPSDPFDPDDPSLNKSADEVMADGRLAANFPAPTIILNEGQKFFLTLTNVGMMIRPDLFDEHTVHFHGFPEAAPVFDGVPDSSVAIGMGASLTYFYDLVGEGTFMYHCHVEATEHMQMGMLGNLYVRPIQNQTGYGPGTVSQLGGGNANRPLGYAYNDGDGSTAYDVEMPIQMGNFDPNFHNASYLVQPLPFKDMNDVYPMLNGRGYPDTVNPAAITTSPEDVAGWQVKEETQPVHALIEADAGDRILLRISNLNQSQINTLATNMGTPMKVVGRDARWLGTDNYYDTNSVTLGGGQAYDVILDTAGVPEGTYLLYTTNMNNLSNNNEDFGGMMTEIRIN